jgi:uncharacterized repeat protein (TIGR03803 family)
MNRNFYPLVIVLCFFAKSGLATPSAKETLVNKTSSTSFISKPADNTVNCEVPSLKVTASVVTGAKRYTIELNVTADFSGSSIIKTSSKDNERTLIFTGLNYLTTYYARVKTDLSPQYGKVSKFTTQAEKFPSVSEPADGEAAANPVVLKLIVTPVPQAKRYLIEINTASDFSKSSLHLSSTSDYQNTFLVKNLNYSTTYFVRVKADISTTYGPVSTFTTRNEVPAKRLWGLTTMGGLHSSGTIFSVSIDSATFIKHHDYIETNDYPTAYTSGTLVHAAEGGFYGNSECTNNGTCGNGEIFYVSPQGEYEMRYSIGLHAGDVMLASNNHLYVVDDWINMFRGGIWKLPATGNSGGTDLSHIIFQFVNRAHGLNPKSALLEIGDGYLYGMTPYGGKNNHGVIYKIALSGKPFQIIHNFKLTETGGYPMAGLVAGNDGYLYGTTSEGGVYNDGTIFKILPDGTNFSTLHHFTDATGKYPHGNLTLVGNELYGASREGGDAGQGVMFKIKTDGTSFAKLLDFSDVNGKYPVGVPTIMNQTIYMMTSRGGVNDLGVIFSMNMDGTDYIKLFDFSEDSGGVPDGSLLLAEDVLATKSADSSMTFVEENHKSDRNSYAVGLHPNPFISDFTVEVKGNLDESVQLILTDMNGLTLQNISATTNSFIPLGNDLPLGFYILKVIRGEEISTHRIIKK